MNETQRFLDYKQEILSLKPILEKIKITDQNIQEILHVLSFNRYQEYSGEVFDLYNAQNELVNMLNSLKNFEKFQIDILKTDLNKLSIEGEYFLYKKKNTPVPDNTICPYYGFLRESGEIKYRGEENTLVYPIFEKLLYSNNTDIQSAIVKHFARSFIDISFSGAKSVFKGEDDINIEKRVRDNLNQLNSYFMNYFTWNPNDGGVIVSNVKKGDEKFPFYTDSDYLRLSITMLNRYLPEFKNYLPYFLLPRKIDVATIPVAKEYITKIAEFNDKSLELVKNDTQIKKDYTERLLEIIFNHYWIVNKHQEHAIKAQTPEHLDLYNFILDNLPKRAKNKRLGSTDKKIPILSSGFHNELSIEIECPLKEFTSKTGITKETIKNYLMDIKMENGFHPMYNPSGSKKDLENIYLLESKGTVKFGLIHTYPIDEVIANKKELEDFYALVVFEKLISVLQKYNDNINSGKRYRVDTENLHLRIDLNALKAEVRTKVIMDRIELIDKIETNSKNKRKI